MPQGHRVIHRLQIHTHDSSQHILGEDIGKAVCHGYSCPSSQRQGSKASGRPPGLSQKPSLLHTDHSVDRPQVPLGISLSVLPFQTHQAAGSQRSRHGLRFACPTRKTTWWTPREVYSSASNQTAIVPASVGANWSFHSVYSTPTKLI